MLSLLLASASLCHRLLPHPLLHPPRRRRWCVKAGGSGRLSPICWLAGGGLCQTGFCRCLTLASRHLRRCWYGHIWRCCFQLALSYSSVLYVCMASAFHRGTLGLCCGRREARLGRLSSTYPPSFPSSLFSVVISWGPVLESHLSHRFTVTCGTLESTDEYVMLQLHTLILSLGLRSVSERFLKTCQEHFVLSRRALSIAQRCRWKRGVREKEFGAQRLCSHLDLEGTWAPSVSPPTQHPASSSCLDGLGAQNNHSQPAGAPQSVECGG